MGGIGSGRYPAKRYKSVGQLVKQLDACTPRALANLREFLEADDDKLRWAATQWCLEKATGKPRQEVAVMSQERVDIVIRMIGPDGERLELPEDGAIDVESREVEES